jgi:hypothetical protein
VLLFPDLVSDSIVSPVVVPGVVSKLDDEPLFDLLGEVDVASDLDFPPVLFCPGSGLPAPG